MACRAAALVALMAFLAAACSSTVAPERPPLGIANGTTLTVTLVVNGRPIALLWTLRPAMSTLLPGDLQSGGDAAHREPDEPLEVVARCVPGGERPQPGQAADLELGEGVDVGVAELDRAGDGG